MARLGQVDAYSAVQAAVGTLQVLLPLPAGSTPYASSFWKVFPISTRKNRQSFHCILSILYEHLCPHRAAAQLYTEALEEPDVVGISIATRPDCLGDDVIALLSSLKDSYPDKFIWVELGLQTMHEETARFIRRGYPLSTFEEALNRLHAISVPVIVHVILGLPHESKEMMIKTCNYLNSCHIDGIKLQLLHVLKNTDLAALYEQKTFDILSLEEYIDIVITCLEVLSPDIVIHRVTGDGPKELLLAPAWSLNKRHVLNTLHQQLRLRDSWQGRYYESTNQ